MISIIIVNYFSEALIISLLNSIFKFEKGVEFEVIVVNNGGDLNELQRQFSTIRVIEDKNNNGFAYANNLGFSIAKGRFILFLNPDTIFIQPTLNKCVEMLSSDKEIGAIGCKLLNEDLSLQYSYHDGHSIFKKLFWRNPIIIKYLGGTFKARKSIDEIKIKHNFNHQPPWISGAFVLMKHSDIVTYDLKWDEDFFMYWEDVELSQRILKRGLKLQYLSEPAIIHLIQGGASLSSNRFNMMEDAKMVYIKKRYGIFIFRLYLLLFRAELKFEKFLALRKDPNFQMQTSTFIYELNYHAI